jgi:hypothetical protein
LIVSVACSQQHAAETPRTYGASAARLHWNRGFATSGSKPHSACQPTVSAHRVVELRQQSIPWAQGKVPSWVNQKRKEVNHMKYEKPEILSVDDAATSIQDMLKNVIAADFNNGSGQPPAYPADE